MPVTVTKVPSSFRVRYRLLLMLVCMQYSQNLPVGDMHMLIPTQIVGIVIAIGLTVCACLARRDKDDFEFTKARKKKGSDFEFSNTS